MLKFPTFFLIVNGGHHWLQMWKNIALVKCRLFLFLHKVTNGNIFIDSAESFGRPKNIYLKEDNSNICAGYKVHSNENPIYVFPEKELLDLRPQYPYSCVSEHFIYFQDWSTYFPAAE